MFYINALEDWRKLSHDRFVEIRNTFQSKGHVLLPKFMSKKTLKALEELWAKIKPYARRRELEALGDLATPRRMFTVSAIEIDNASADVNDIYFNLEILSLLSQIAGMAVHPLSDPIEKYVFNQLTHLGDTQGKHLDTFPFACTYVLEAPLSDSGGALELDVVLSGAIARTQHFYLHSGDLFFFRSALIPHGVTPLTRVTSRVVLNVAYATEASRSQLSDSRDRLYS